MIKDLTGNKIGSVIVLEKTSKRVRGYVVYECKCERCGKIFEQNSKYLLDRKKNKKNTSCGCYLKTGHLYKNGLSNTRIYRIYKLMQQRCRDKNAPAYKNYGGRGIKVCDEWNKDFLEFYNWALKNGYKEDLTIDRIDNNKGYFPENCRWVNRQTQNNNKRNIILIDIDGDKKTIRELSKQYNLEFSTLKTRIKRGWDIKRALNEPTHANYKGKKIA